MKLLYTLSTLALFVTLCSATAAAKATPAQEQTTKPNYEYKLTGRVDINLFTNTHELVAGRGGLQWLYPSAPRFNNDGVDIRQYNMLRFSAAGTRLGGTLKITNFAKGAVGFGRIEGDFIGLSDDL